MILLRKIYTVSDSYVFSEKLKRTNVYSAGGGGCGSCTHCGSYARPYNTSSGGGCVIIEEWVTL